MDQFKAIKILSLYPESRLYKAVKIQSGEEFTIKKIVLPNEKIISKNYLIKEAEILKRIEAHKNVASLFQVIEGNNAIYEVFEEVEYSLEEYLDIVRSKGQVLQWQEISKFIKQICSGVAHLEMNGIIHGDICSKNIFLNK